MIKGVPKFVRESGVGRFGDCNSPSLCFSKFPDLGLVAKVEESEERHEVLKNFVAYYNNNKREHIKAPKQNEWTSTWGKERSKIISGKTAGRLIVNQQGGVLENCGLCLHRFFGFPYIPGSAVKGVARHRAWERWNDEQNPEEKKNLAEKIAKTFGFPTGDKELDKFITENKICGKSDANSGNVAFLDAVPKDVRNISLVEDVATPHHKKYYSGNSGKAFDDEDPQPLFFPAVEEGASFEFHVIALSKDADLEFAADVLKEAISVNGIGAKTVAGFGWFKDVEIGEGRDAVSGKYEQKFKNMGNSKFKGWLKDTGICDEEVAAFQNLSSELLQAHQNWEGEIKKLHKKEENRVELKRKLGDDYASKFHCNE